MSKRKKARSKQKRRKTLQNAARAKQRESNDKKLKAACLVSFYFGVCAVWINSFFALLTLGLPLLVAVSSLDKISRFLFGRPYEYQNNYDGEPTSWSDILLSIPFLLIGLLPMFFIGELADCYHGSTFWGATFGLCR